MEYLSLVTIFCSLTGPLLPMSFRFVLFELGKILGDFIILSAQLDEAAFWLYYFVAFCLLYSVAYMIAVCVLKKCQLFKYHTHSRIA